MVEFGRRPTMMSHRDRSPVMMGSFQVELSAADVRTARLADQISPRAVGPLPRLTVRMAEP